MTRHARLVGLVGALLVIGAMTPVTSALAAATPAPIVAPPAPDAVCPLNADTDFATISAIGPSVVEVLDPGDCGGAATTIRPLSVTAVRSTLGMGSVTTDGARVLYNPTTCKTGTDFVDYTITDGSTSDTGTLIVSIARPTVSPVTDAPTAGFVTGTTIGTTVPVRVSWCGVPTSGASVAGYRVVQSTNGGTSYATTPIYSGGATSTTRNLGITANYRWKVRTTDSRKGPGGYVASLVTRVTSVQDSGGRIAYSSGWRTASSSKYAGGKEHYIARSGATATLTVSNVRQFAIVASRASGRGSFHVYVDGRRVTTSAISQRSSTTSWRRVLYVGSIPGSTASTHTIQVRTASSSRVDLDTILTLSGKQTPAVTFSSPLPGAAIVNGTPDPVAASSSSGLPVTLAIDPASWGACSLGAGSISYHGRGTCLVRATQAGDPSWNAATSQQAFAVAGLAQAITFGPLAGATYGDAAVTVSATSDADPVLAVEHSSQTPAVCSVSGATVSILAAGTCTVRASQPGDATRAAAVPVDQSFEVAQVNLTVTGISASDRAYDGTTVAVLDTDNAALVGVLGADDVTLDTTGASGVFPDAGVGIARTVTVSGLVLGGTKAANYSLSQPATTATIAKADQAVTFTSEAPPNPVKDGPSYTPSATASSGLAVAFSIESIPSGVCTIDGSGVVAFIGSGTCVVRADQAGSSNYNAAAQSVQNLTVASTGSTPQAISFTQPDPATYGGASITLAATSDSGLGVTLVSLDPSVCTVTGASAVPEIAGTCRIEASQAGDPTFAAADTVIRTLTVNRRPITVRAVAATKTYDGDLSSTGSPTITSGTLASGDSEVWTQTYDTATVGTGKTLTPTGSVSNGPASVTASYLITFAPVNTGVINPGPATKLVVSGFTSPTVAGVADTVTVTAQDQFNNTATGYTGTVAITSSDPQAVLPSSATLTSGSGTFEVTLRTAGSWTITATDTVTGSITGASGSITVNPGAAAAIVIASAAGGGTAIGAESVASGAGLTVYANSVDSSGNVIANVAVTWSLTGRTGGVANGDLVAAGNGKSAVFTGALVGTATIHADDGAFTDDTGTITVTAGAPDHLDLTPGAAILVAGGTVIYTAEAFDLAGNSLGDVTGSTTFSIAPDGSCTEASCTASVAGEHLVTGALGGGVAGTASVTVNP